MIIIHQYLTLTRLPSSQSAMKPLPLWCALGQQRLRPALAKIPGHQLTSPALTWLHNKFLLTSKPCPRLLCSCHCHCELSLPLPLRLDGSCSTRRPYRAVALIIERLRASARRLFETDSLEARLAARGLTCTRLRYLAFLEHRAPPHLFSFPFQHFSPSRVARTSSN